jgi:hypothetical protein
MDSSSASPRLYYASRRDSSIYRRTSSPTCPSSRDLDRLNHRLILIPPGAHIEVYRKG